MNLIDPMTSWAPMNLEGPIGSMDFLNTSQKYVSLACQTVKNFTRRRTKPASILLISTLLYLWMTPRQKDWPFSQEKNGNFLYRDEGDQQKLSKRSINLSGQGHSLFFSLTADNFRYNQNNTLSVRSQLTLNFIHSQ